MKILVTICARGGSKGVKNKNIRLLAGKPLINYTINLVKKWGKAERVICSTDSSEIAEIAKSNGICVPFIRPKELSTDKSGKIEVIRHALVNCEKIFKEKYDLVVDLDVTNPVRTIEDLDSCLEIYQEKKPDVLFSVVEAKKNPYFNMVEVNKEGYAEISKKINEKILRRQDAPKVYIINCSIYLYNPSFLLNVKNNSVFSTNKIGIYEMRDISSTDIDTELDFKHLEFLIKEKVISI